MHRWSEAQTSAGTTSAYICDVTHFIDTAAGMALRFGPFRSRIFPDGWGDRLTVEMLTEPDILTEPVAGADVVWGRKQEHRGRRVTRGQFSSPLGKLLPSAARAVTVEFTEPASGTGPIAILLPAWNDHDFDQRRRLGALLLDHGIGSIIFDIPLYGSRRLTSEREPAIRTVADFAIMGLGAVREARALAALFHRPTGYVGFSMGGNLAALASATSESPVATATLAASHSPGPVYLDGVLSRAIAWDALGGRSESGSLREVLTGASVLRYPARPHHRSAVLVAAERDGFVPMSAAAQLADHWGAELRRIPGGHATALWRHRRSLGDAMAASFERIGG